MDKNINGKEVIALHTYVGYEGLFRVIFFFIFLKRGCLSYILLFHVGVA